MSLLLVVMRTPANGCKGLSVNESKRPAQIVAARRSPAIHYTLAAVSLSCCIPKTGIGAGNVPSPSTSRIAMLVSK